MDTQKKNLSYWVTYDFGNSFYVAALSGLFLGQWLILDNKLDDIWYGAAFSIATIFVLISSPFFGAWSDKIGKRMPFMRWTTYGLVFFLALMSLVAFSDFALSTKAMIILGLFVVVQYLYQVNLIFDNALLEEVSEENNRGKISGIGEIFNSFGWLLATLIFLPFASGAITVFGQPGRLQVIFPAFVISTILALPLLLWFKEVKFKPRDVVLKKTESVYKRTIDGIKYLIHEDKNAGIFLISFALISDIALTLNLYFAVVMDSLYHVDDTFKSMVFVISMASTMIFNYVFGKLADIFGNKIMIIITCLTFTAVTSMFFLSSAPWILYLVAIFGGAGIGGYYAVTRSMMIKLAPPDKLGEYFGFYSTFQRFASITAPLIWGGITFYLKDSGELKYRVAGMTMVGLLIIGTLVLTKVKEKH
jgi:UMF1 family MFS transporter